MTSRTRYLAGTVAALATTLAAMPFIGAGPASAAAGAIVPSGTVTSGDLDWYLGQTVTVAYTANSTRDELGPYKVTLWNTNDAGAEDDKRVATIAVGTGNAPTSIAWSIPATMTKLVGENLELRLESSTTPAAFAAVKATQPVDILQSNVNTVTGVESATGSLKPGGQVKIGWKSAGVVGSKVTVGLVSTDGKRKITLDTVANADGTNAAADFDLPASITPGAYKAVVTPVLKSGKAATSSELTIAALTGPTATGADVERGETFTYSSDEASATTPVDFVLRDQTTKKVVLKLATKVISTDDQEITIPYSVKAGTYDLVASFSGVKESDGKVAAVDVTTPAIGTPTIDTAITDIASQLELIGVTFADGGVSNTISLVKGTKVTPLLSKVPAGEYLVEIPATATASVDGSDVDTDIDKDYTIIVTNDALKKTDDEYKSTASDAFSIATNATKLG